ncbi:DUF5776 domain-containing protein [Levilactobacillus lanxiensis]|uniref:DUF5776 domain-containing protein n=1 Tax=Levilactobacillus lanxiensis TaxID=2799568 RepID=A0ABW4D0F3_9LACO|nr:DUF5776 domain-containing protein [Levilactobacillus lanxiensis]
MTRGLSKLMTATFTLILLGGVATPAVAYADSSTDTVAATTKADDKITYHVGAVETPYVLISSTSGIKKTPIVTGWPESLTTEQLNDDDYMTKFIADHPENTVSDSNDVRDAMLGIVANELTASPKESYADFILASSGPAGNGYTAESLAKLSLLNSYVKLWDAYIHVNLSLKLMNREDVIKDYAENAAPELLKLNAPQSIIDAYNPGKYPEETFNDKLAKVYESDYVMLKENQLFSKISDEQFVKLDPAKTINEQLKLWLAPLSNYFTKLPDGSYKVSGLMAGGFQFLNFGTPDPVIPDPTPTPTPAKSQPVTVTYVDDQGKTLAPSKTLTGDLDTTYQSDALNIAGYKLSKTPANATGKFTSAAQTVTYVYTKQGTLQSGSAADTIETNTLAPKGAVVYATKKVGLYKTATFSKKNLKRWYVKKSRTNRPMFVVTGYATSKNGVKRYRVKDVNHHSKTAGKTGYLTTNNAYTTPVYYAAKHKTVTVINPTGVNSYAKKTLTGKKTHYRQGQTLTVKKVVSNKLTTRFVLKNGRYMTANKKLVQAGKVTMPRQIKTKHAINRYSNVNLTKQNRHLKKGTKLAVRGWAYSNANNFSKHDTLRYHVAGGYITANRHLVKTVR